MPGLIKFATYSGVKVDPDSQIRYSRRCDSRGVRDAGGLDATPLHAQGAGRGEWPSLPHGGDEFVRGRGATRLGSFRSLLLPGFSGED